MDKQREIRVGAAQIDTDSDLCANVDKIWEYMEAARKAACNVLFFHEGCLAGYPGRDRIGELDFAAVGDYEKELRELAGSLKMALLMGSASLKDGRVFNDVMVVDEYGRLLGRYAKTWRAGEPWYTAGFGPVLFTVAGIEAMVVICHDLRYPDLVRLPVTAGARIVFIANNESGLDVEHKLLGYRSMQISRATENHVFVIMANAPADAEKMGRTNAPHGNSKIIDPMGNVLDEAGSFEERLVLATIDVAAATRQTVLRTIGEDSVSRARYGCGPENPAFAEWMGSGMAMVRRLTGDSR